jgi:hypothetical protein
LTLWAGRTRIRLFISPPPSTQFRRSMLSHDWNRRR